MSLPTPEDRIRIKIEERSRELVQMPFVTPGPYRGYEELAEAILYYSECLGEASIMHSSVEIAEKLEQLILKQTGQYTFNKLQDKVKQRRKAEKEDEKPCSKCGTNYFDRHKLIKTKVSFAGVEVNCLLCDDCLITLKRDIGYTMENVLKTEAKARMYQKEL